MLPIGFVNRFDGVRFAHRSPPSTAQVRTERERDLARDRLLVWMRFSYGLIRCIGELDDEITGLHKQIRMLKGVAQEIGTEAKFQNEFLNQLQSTLVKAQAGVKNNMRRLNRSINQHGTNHVVHVICFGLLLFTVVYLLAKISRR